MDEEYIYSVKLRRASKSIYICEIPKASFNPLIRDALNKAAPAVCVYVNLFLSHSRVMFACPAYG